MADHSLMGNLTPDLDPVRASTDANSAAAAEIQRGVCRVLRALGHSVVRPSFRLPTGAVPMWWACRRVATSGSLRSSPAWLIFRRRQMGRVPTALRPAL